MKGKVTFMNRKELFRCIVVLILCIIGLFIIIAFFPSGVISYVCSTLIGSLIAFLIGKIYKLLVLNGLSHFTGYYRDEIFSKDNPLEIIKRDKFELIEKSGSIISGEFVRYFPEKSTMTHWKCSGFIVLDQFLLSYRAIKDVTPSRGVILVKLDTTRENGFFPCYKGKYFKYEGEKIVEYNINLIKISKEEYNNI